MRSSTQDSLSHYRAGAVGSMEEGGTSQGSYDYGISVFSTVEDK